MNIRQAVINDAENLAHLISQVERESEFMLYEAGERNTSKELQEKMINYFNLQNNLAIFVAEEDHQLHGYLLVMGGQANKNKHSAYIVIGIRSQSTGQGVGTQLFQEMEKWAKEVGLHRLELTVIQHNESAFHLYKKVGFEVEGVKKDSLYIDEQYVDEYYMAKLI
ncbi:N-acetyltransferase [Filobacillus milosensis]|uniref:N-acetyltransferase n=1 Tax=Filobacillus milosensis TaxID=94137 RepID=A0A4Y8IMX4_9BACI|nr:GNAT family protein [Filobacillus milosensis]TFB21339.1 N-acetyltransferase [Filobacillus milosensis]